MGCQSHSTPFRTKAQPQGTSRNSTSSTPHARTILSDLLRGGPFLSRDADQLSAPARTGSAVSPEPSGPGLKQIPKLGLVGKAAARTTAKRTNMM